MSRLKVRGDAPLRDRLRELLVSAGGYPVALADERAVWLIHVAQDHQRRLKFRTTDLRDTTALLRDGLADALSALKHPGIRQYVRCGAVTKITLQAFEAEASALLAWAGRTHEWAGEDAERRADRWRKAPKNAARDGLLHRVLLELLRDGATLQTRGKVAPWVNTAATLVMSAAGEARGDAALRERVRAVLPRALKRLALLSRA